MRAYIASLSDYNAGILHGVWIDLEGKDEDDISAEINVMLGKSKAPNVTRARCADCGHFQDVSADMKADEFSCDVCGSDDFNGPFPSAEEWAVHDHEDATGILDRLGECTSAEALARAGEIEYELSDYDPVVVEVAFEYEGNGADAADLKRWIEDNYNGEYDSEKAYAEQLADDTGMLSEVPEGLRFYFDFDAFARDLFISDYFSRSGTGGVHVFSN